MRPIATMAPTRKLLRSPSIQKLTYRNVLEFFFQIHDPTTPTGRATMRDPAIDPPFFISMTNSGRSRRRRSQTLKPLESGRARSSPRSLQRGRFGGRSRNIRTTSSVIPTGTRAISFDRPGRLPAKQINSPLIRSYLLRVSDIRYRVGFVRLLRAPRMKALKEVCSSQNVVGRAIGDISPGYDYL